MRVAGRIAVLVDSRELVGFAGLREGDSGVLNLTTMLPDQDRANIEVYLVNGSRSERIHTFRASEIRRGKPRPQIVISAHVRGRLTVTLRIDGELIASEHFDVPTEMTAFRWGRLIAALLIVLAIAGLASGVWWLVSRGPLSYARPPEPLAPPRIARPATAEPLPATAEPQPAPEIAPPLEPEEARAALSIESTELFDPDSAEILSETRSAIYEIADRIARWTAAGGAPESIDVRVEGHTALYGNEQLRAALSRRRAEAAAEELRNRLASLGITVGGISATGRGGREPVTLVEADQWRNRRVEFSVTAAAE